MYISLSGKESSSSRVSMVLVSYGLSGKECYRSSSRAIDGLRSRLAVVLSMV